MYFKKTVCPNCQASHDELSDYCPFCHHRNEEHADFRNKNLILFLPVSREIFLFLLGLLGLSVFSILFSLIFRNIYVTDEIYGSFLINIAVYLTFFVFVVAIIAPYYRPLWDKLKRADVYLYGLIGSILLIGGSILIGYLMQILVPSAGEGSNQSAISEMTRAYPAICIIVFGVIGPICEEAAYRVGLFSFLRRIHPAVAYIFTSLIFALIHFDFSAPDLITELVVLPSYIFGGVVFSFLYDKRGFGASTFAHIFNNLFSLIGIVVLQNV